MHKENLYINLCIIQFVQIQFASNLSLLINSDFHVLDLGSLLLHSAPKFAG